MEMEVLFEVDGSRKTLSVSNGTLVYEIEKEIKQLGKNGILAYFSCVRGKQPATSQKRFHPAKME